MPSIAQQLSGKILGEENLPLYGATIYFDGTTIGTTTDENGYFELNLKTFPNGKLIISHVGYETVYLDEFISPISLSLQPTALALNEVILEPIPFSRKELIKAFREPQPLRVVMLKQLLQGVAPRLQWQLAKVLVRSLVSPSRQPDHPGADNGGQAADQAGDCQQLERLLEFHVHDVLLLVTLKKKRNCLATPL